MNQLSEVAASLMEHCTADERVCPRGDKWQELWKMLPEDSTKAGREKMPPQPLILAAASCEPWEKRMRVKDHIAWADAQGVIEQVNSFLRDLPFEEWERSTSNCIKDGSYGSWLCSERDRAMIEDYVDNNDVEGMTIYLSEGGVAPDSASLCVAAGRGYNDMLDLLLDAGIVPDADAICSVVA